MKLTVGEISKVLGISNENIRYYVRTGLLNPEQNVENNSSTVKQSQGSSTKNNTQSIKKQRPESALKRSKSKSNLFNILFSSWY